MGSWNHSLYYTCGKVVEFSLVRMRTALQPTPKKARPAARVWVLIRAKRANPGTKGVGTVGCVDGPSWDRRLGAVLMGSGRLTPKLFNLFQCFLCQTSSWTSKNVWKSIKERGPFKKSPAGNDLLPPLALASGCPVLSCLFSVVMRGSFRSLVLLTPSDNKNLNGRLLDPKI